MMRAQVASTATGSFPATKRPQGLASPWSGPLPSMPMMPSTMAKSGRTVLLISRIDSSEARPVQRIFGPAVTVSRHDAEHVLQGERDSRPMVGLQLRHGDHEIGLEHGPRQIKFLDPGGTGARGHEADIVEVEVNKFARQRPQVMTQAVRLQDTFRVPFMPGPFSDNNTPRAHAQEAFPRRRYQCRMSIDHALRVRLDEVRLQQHCDPLHLQIELTQRLLKQRGQVNLIVGRSAYGDARRGPPERRDQRIGVCTHLPACRATVCRPLLNRVGQALLLHLSKAEIRNQILENRKLFLIPNL